MEKKVGEKAELQEILFSLADVNDIWYKVTKQVVYHLWQSSNESTSLYHNRAIYTRKNKTRLK